MTYDNLNQFEDEPSGGIDEFDEIPVSSEKVEFDGLKQAAAKAERRRERRRRRNERTGKIAACVILFIIILALVLSGVFIRETEHLLYQDSLTTWTESPSMRPTEAKPTVRVTQSPTVAPNPTFSVMTPSPFQKVEPKAPPTNSPTMAPTSIMMDSYTFEPVADTFLHLNGPYKTKIYGREETLRVQRGNKESTLPGQEVTLPTILSVIQFDTTQESGNTKKLPKRSRWPEAEDQVKVTLRIHHVPKDNTNENMNDEMAVEDILPVNVAVYRLPNNHDMVVEQLTGEVFQNAPRSVTEGILIAKQKIEATTTVMDIDVTSAMFLSEDSLNSAFGDEQVFLMLKVYWEETAHAKDLFSSREADGQSPQLIFSNMV